jgi:hypothetical protein
MARRKPQESGQVANSFHFSLTGLILFMLALMAGASFITWKLARSGAAHTEPYAVDTHDKAANVSNGAWGSLLTRDIELQRPAEYLTEEVPSQSRKSGRSRG